MWAALCGLAPERGRPTRSLLLRQGDPGTHVLVMTSGSAAITRRDGRGRRTLLAVRGAGELFGELAVFDDGVRSASVLAVEPCRLHTVPATDFHRFVADHHLTLALLRHAVGRVRESEEIRQELATAPVPVRLASALLRLAAPSGQQLATPVVLRLTQDELAQLIGASRNTVVQALAPWRTAGWVQATAGGGLVLYDLGPLHRLLQSA